MNEYFSLFDKDIFDMNFTEFMASSFGVLIIFVLLVLLLFLILKVYFFFYVLNDMRKEFLKEHMKEK